MTEHDIDATKAPLMEHLMELRTRLLWSLVAIFICFLVCFYFANDIYNILLWPYQQAVGGETRIEMIYTAPQEFFFTQLKLSLFGAIFLAFPIIASQLYMFVAPGLYKNERNAFLPFLIATPILFLLGGALVYFIVMPLAMGFFLSMQQTGDAQVTTVDYTEPEDLDRPDRQLSSGTFAFQAHDPGSHVAYRNIMVKVLDD